MTQEKLSELIDIKPENYSRIENGLSFPKPQNLEKIADVLNIEIYDLFKFSNSPNISRIKARIVFEFLSKIGKL